MAEDEVAADCADEPGEWAVKGSGTGVDLPVHSLLPLVLRSSAKSVKSADETLLLRWSSADRRWSDGTLVAGQQYGYQYDDIGKQWDHIPSIDNSGRIGRISTWLDRFLCVGPRAVSLSSTGATPANVSSAPTTTGAAFASCPNSPGGVHGGWRLCELVGRIAGLNHPSAGLGVKRIKRRRARDPACDRFIGRIRDEILKLRM